MLGELPVVSMSTILHEMGNGSSGCTIMPPLAWQEWAPYVSACKCLPGYHPRALTMWTQCRGPPVVQA